MSAIELRKVFGRQLQGVDHALGPGIHVVLGTAADGTEELARVLAGCERPRRGTVLVGGEPPWGSPGVRRRLGTVLAVEPSLTARSVGSAVQTALRLRGDSRDAAALLGESGLGAWAARRPSELTLEMRRRLALLLALSSTNPLALVLDEPVGLEPTLGTQALRERLALAAKAGACVVVLTASPRVASDLDGEVLLLDRGRFVRRPGAPLSLELTPGRVTTLHVHTASAREVLARLAIEPAVAAARFDAEAAPEQLTLTGPDADALSLATMRAARATGAKIDAIRLGLPGLDEARAATAGLWRGTYDAAYRRAQEHARPRAETPAAPPPAAPPSPAPTPEAGSDGGGGAP